VLYATENSNNEDNLKKFSWAGNANSSYSFGIIQFDVNTDHGGVKQFLRDHGFTSEDIEALAKQGGGLSKAELEPYNAKLAAVPRADLDEFTNKNLGDAVDRIDALIGSLQKTNPSVAAAIAASDELQLAIADYDNQFTIERIGQKALPNSMLAYLEGQTVKMPGGTLSLSDSITRSDVQSFIDATEYSQKHQKAMADRTDRLNGALADLGILDRSLVAQHRSADILKRGAHGDAVGDLQAKLGELGYGDARGNPLVADKGFGANTKFAVENFQRDHGLAVDGAVGSDTMKALNEQLQARAQAQPSAIPQSWQCPTRLDDPAYPDNAFYLRTRDLVYQLDQQHGRAPDQRSDQLAAALTAQARTEGLQRIDQVALNEDASVIWGAQRPPGARDHFFDRLCNVNTVQAMDTSMEQSGANWSQAMRQFQDHQEQARQQQEGQEQGQQLPGAMRMQ
jgi:peptidoglycan hydrolase-like protein with peptidoglycan-binding domain